MLGGILTAIATPFRDDAKIDFEAFQRLAQHLVDNGSEGLVVVGTTGESPTLSDSERNDLFARRSRPSATRRRSSQRRARTRPGTPCA